MLRIKEKNSYELDDIKIHNFLSPASADDEIEEEQVISVTAQAVVDIVKERPTKAVLEKKEVTSRYFGTIVVITEVKLNSKKTLV